MTTYKIDQPAHPLHNHEFEEYTAFARYQSPRIEYVPLLIGANQVRFFALCNLREVEAAKPITDSELVQALAIGLAEVRKTPEANDSGLDYCYPQPLAPVQGCALPPRFVDNITALAEVLNGRDQERQKSRDLYVLELFEKIEAEVA